MSDAVGEGWDIVVRAGELPQDSEMTVRKLCNITLSLYASPDYLARHTPIESAADLVNHEAVIFRGFTGRLRPWSIAENGHIREFSPSPVLIVSDGQAGIDATAVG